MQDMSNFRNSKVSVWWDLDNCSIPPNVDAFLVAKNVTAMLQNACLVGPTTIDAFGDIQCLGRNVSEGLSTTGIDLNHIPLGTKDAADKAILVAMLFWALENAPPASLVLISSDGDFANALHRLRLKGYNVLLVQPDQTVQSALCGAASSVWYWTSVVYGNTHIDGFVEPARGWVSVNDMKYEFLNIVWVDFGLFLQGEKHRECMMTSNTRYLSRLSVLYFEVEDITLSLGSTCFLW
ncbi:hypothetical protein L7F22_011986 [Adiantum nelumboides]|nr:hypothetical protein [Adiantum nelumboides]